MLHGQQPFGFSTVEPRHDHEMALSNDAVGRHACCAPGCCCDRMPRFFVENAHFVAPKNFLTCEMRGPRNNRVACRVQQITLSSIAT